jgi:hypothetical protein
VLCDYPAFVNEEPKKQPSDDPWRGNEASRRRQLPEDRKRSEKLTPDPVRLRELLARLLAGAPDRDEAIERAG